MEWNEPSDERPHKSVSVTCHNNLIKALLSTTEEEGEGRELYYGPSRILSTKLGTTTTN